MKASRDTEKNQLKPFDSLVYNTSNTNIPSRKIHEIINT